MFKLSKPLLKYFIYFSIICLFVALYKYNYLTIPRIYNLSLVIFSYIFLFLGFAVEVFVWRNLLLRSGCAVSFRDCLIATGISVLGKYIPGKVWLVLGRAAYISEVKSISLSEVSYNSLKMQLIASWTGLLVGTIGLIILGGILNWAFIIFSLWIFFSIIIFSKKAHSFTERIIRVMLKREINLPRLSLTDVVKILPGFILNWLLWSYAFYLLVQSISLMPINLTVGLAFPLAATLGVIAIIAPGGLGAREGVLAGYLVLSGLTLTEATSITIVSRLWFLIAEIVSFLTGLILKNFVKSGS